MTTTEVGHRVDIRVQDSDSKCHSLSSQEQTVSAPVDQGGDDRDENSCKTE